MERHLNTEQLRQFETHLLCEERSAATVEKYLHDLRVFYAFMDGKELNKTAVLEYKSKIYHKQQKRKNDKSKKNIGYSFDDIFSHDLLLDLARQTAAELT